MLSAAIASRVRKTCPWLPSAGGAIHSVSSPVITQRSRDPDQRAAVGFDPLAAVVAVAPPAQPVHDLSVGKTARAAARPQVRRRPASSWCPADWLARDNVSMNAVSPGLVIIPMRRRIWPEMRPVE